MAGVVITAGVVLAATVGFGRGQPPTPAAAPVPAQTAPVVRTTLVENATLKGTLGYGPATALSAATTTGGTVTWLPKPGDTVTRGEPLYRVDELAVALLYGTLPAYRPLSVGAEGADVRQLEENLVALGYRGVSVDTKFTEGTATALRQWQGKLGRQRTGVLDPAEVAYAPGPLRIGSLAAQLGAPATGTVLHHTGIGRTVTAELDAKNQALATVGAPVTVTLPDGQQTAGTITAIGTVATKAEQTEPDGSPSGGGQESAATIALTVAVADQAALGRLDQAPVKVALRATERANVLAVPVTALLALREGGYGLEVLDCASGTEPTRCTSRVVAVTTGMFAGGQVEVSGAGITEGTTVGVAL